jgi:hypothetical protein
VKVLLDDVIDACQDMQNLRHVSGVAFDPFALIDLLISFLF